MENMICLFADGISLILMIVFGLICLLALIRICIKFHRGEKISISPIGVMKDLPDSITGMNKHKD